MMALDFQTTKRFQEQVYAWYSEHGRMSLPWRTTEDVYAILVSEIMLQQTQVDRVIPKYRAFMDAFPTVETLAQASLAQVLGLWVGLGYNRRARMLHQSAKEVVGTYNGVFPRTQKELESLPGIGPYTAGAVCAFAYNMQVVMIETNIRTVFIHEFYSDVENVSDAVLLPLIEQTCDTENPRAWYAALMDYGTYLKKSVPNPSRKSKHHVRQSAFKGSLREVRGYIIKTLTCQSASVAQLTQSSKFSEDRIQEALEGLAKDALVMRSRNKWIIATESQQ